MKQVYRGKILWIDINNPTKEDIDYLSKNYKFHPLILKELATPTQRDKAEIYDDYIYLVTHFPYWNPIKQTSSPWELDIIITKHSIITSTYGPVIDAHQELLEKIYQKDFENAYLNDISKLFYFLMTHYLNFAMRQIVHIQEKINKIEEEIFSGHHHKVIPLISYVKRDILNFRRIFRYLKEDIGSMVRRGPMLLGEGSKIYFEDLMGESLRVDNIIEGLKDNIESLENTNNSYIEYKINLLTKIFTIVSFVGWPTLIIISSFQMNAKYLPLVGRPYDYFIILSVAFVPAVILYFFLKRKNII